MYNTTSSYRQKNHPTKYKINQILEVQQRITLLKYPAKSVLWGCSGSKKENNKFINCQQAMTKRNQL